MDPITVNKLLSVADAIEEHRVGNQLTSAAFNRIIAKQGQVKDIARRVRDILRVFEAFRFLVPKGLNQEVLCLTQDYQNFISAWNSGNLLAMNQELANYPPYTRFLICLQTEKTIRIPQRQDRGVREDLGRYLKNKYDLTFVAFDTFRTWVICVGQAYLSPFEESLCWGGEWDEERPSLECFKDTCYGSYCQIDKTSGYANLGRLADLVCQKLCISFQAFEMKMNQFINTFPGEVKLAPATIRRELSRRFQITTIRSRREILKERVAAKLRGVKQLPQSRWLEHRYLEDGIHVNGKQIKLIRWEAKS